MMLRVANCSQSDSPSGESACGVVQQFLEFTLQRVERGAPCRCELTFFFRLVLNATLVGLRGSIVARLQAHSFFPRIRPWTDHAYLSRVASNYLWINRPIRLIRRVAFQ